MTGSHFNVDSPSFPQAGAALKFPVLLFFKRFNWRKGLSAEEAGLSGIFPRAGDDCETQADAGVTSERPDTGLNSPFQVGRITSGFARR